MLRATVDDEILESDTYSKAGFSSMTGSQRKKVVKLNRQYRNTNNHNNNEKHIIDQSIRLVNTRSNDAMVHAIVAEFSQASRQHTDGMSTIQEYVTSTNNKCKPESRNIGLFIANRRQNTSGQRNK